MNGFFGATKLDFQSYQPFKATMINLDCSVLSVRDYVTVTFDAGNSVLAKFIELFNGNWSDLFRTRKPIMCNFLLREILIAFSLNSQLFTWPYIQEISLIDNFGGEINA